MTALMRVEVVSAEKSLYDGDAVMVVAPGVAGELGILPRHSPLLTAIKPGVLKINLPDGGEELLYVSGGILEVQPEKITILADIAERGEDLDEKRAEESRRAAQSDYCIRRDGAGLCQSAPSGTCASGGATAGSKLRRLRKKAR